MSKRDWTSEELKAFESEVAEEFKEGKIRCPIHLSGGNEEELIIIFKAIKDEDYVFSTHRSHYHFLLKGGSPILLMSELRGSANGVCGGFGRSMHIIDPSIRFYSSAIVGGTPGIAVGVGMGIKKKGGKEHVWCFIGDGGEDTGHFIEAVRFGYGRELPLTFIVEDNDLAVQSTKEMRWEHPLSLNMDNIIEYHYKRTYPHVGVGEFVEF